MKNLFENLKNLSFSKNKTNLYIILIIGVILLIAANILFSNPQKDTAVNVPEKSDASAPDANELETRLSEILSKVQGAGEVDVMVTYDSGTEKIPAQDKKTNLSKTGETSGGVQADTGDVESSSEETTVMVKDGNSQTPFVIKETEPKIRGVLVVADGAGNSSVRVSIQKAVAAVLDVPVHKIEVLQKNKEAKK